MNPRHRRLIIPSLLIALLVVVVIAALTGRADAEEATSSQLVSRIDDGRVVEASGMAISAVHDDLAYVVNDSGQAQAIYAVRVSTGEVVGTTQVTGGTWSDTEAMAIGPDDQIWIADTGDNLTRRDDAALYALPEPGPGDHTVEATRFPVAYDDGPQNVEAMLLHPVTGAIHLVAKGLLAGTVFELPDELRTDAVNRAAEVGSVAAGTITDGAYLPDASSVLLRTYVDVREVDPDDWSVVRSIAVPPVQQGETIAVERGGDSFLVGSEGESSPLIRVAVGSADPVPTSTPEPPAAAAPDASPPEGGNGFAGRTWLLAGGVVAALAGVSWWMARRD